MTDFRADRKSTRWAWNIYGRKQGSVQRMIRACQRDTEISLKGFPLAKSGTVLSTSIMIVMDYNQLNKEIISPFWYKLMNGKIAIWWEIANLLLTLVKREKWRKHKYHFNQGIKANIVNNGIHWNHVSFDMMQ